MLYPRISNFQLKSVESALFMGTANQKSAQEQLFSEIQRRVIKVFKELG